MYLKSDAIVVGRRPFRNTSLVLRCYTRRAGLVTVLAKGAFRRRRKAEPPSVPDLFERGEAVLYIRPPRDVAILREWTLFDMRPGVRSDYEAFQAAAGCAALAAELGPTGGRTGELFEPLERALGELDRGGSPKQVLWAFAFRALARAGFLAPLGACASCGRPFGGGSPEAAAVSAGAGGLVCASCRARPGEEGEGRTSFAVPPEAAAAARFLAASPPGTASRLRVSARAAGSLERMVRALAEYTLERPMPVLSPGEETAFTAKTPRASRTYDRG